ncbi:hypothetical protein AB0910_27905 [Streptomyces sp. NPDC047002]|uniref:hypothetical protein n=1 Tax=Streptomyces sp. NPDC047002 TaxID=3155475 RepID=UPI003452BAFB
MPPQHDPSGRDAATGAPGTPSPRTAATAPAPVRFSEEPGAAADPAATRHRSLATVDDRLHVGAEAVTLATPEGFATVRFAEAAEVLAHPDGGRVLTGPDGVRVAVEPTLYAMLTPERIAALDAALSATAPRAALRTAPRAPEAVPRPPAGEDPRGSALSSRTRAPAPARTRSRGRTAGLYLACLAVAGAALAAVRTTFDQLGAAHPHYTVAAMFWVLTAGLVVVARDLRNPPKDRTHVPRWWEMGDHFRR